MKRGSSSSRGWNLTSSLVALATLGCMQRPAEEPSRPYLRFVDVFFPQRQQAYVVGDGFVVHRDGAEAWVWSEGPRCKSAQLSAGRIWCFHQPTWADPATISVFSLSSQRWESLTVRPHQVLPFPLTPDVLVNGMPALGGFVLDESRFSSGCRDVWQRVASVPIPTFGIRPSDLEQGYVASYVGVSARMVIHRIPWLPLDAQSSVSYVVQDGRINVLTMSDSSIRATSDFPASVLGRDGEMCFAVTPKGAVHQAACGSSDWQFITQLEPLRVRGALYIPVRQCGANEGSVGLEGFDHWAPTDVAVAPSRLLVVVRHSSSPGLHFEPLLVSRADGSVTRLPAAPGAFLYDGREIHTDSPKFRFGEDGSIWAATRFNVLRLSNDQSCWERVLGNSDRPRVLPPGIVEKIPGQTCAAQ